MIYSVVPEELVGELYDRLAQYYADDPNVTVIIDRRKRGGDAPSGEERRGRPASRSAVLPLSAVE